MITQMKKKKSVKSINPCKSVILTIITFDAQGGRGKMWQLFGEEMDGIIVELNKELVA
jgi:hypothetical protein